MTLPPPWSKRSLADPGLPLHRFHSPISFRPFTRFRCAVLLFAFFVIVYTLYDPLFNGKPKVVEEEWKYRIGEQLKMGMESMTVEGMGFVDGERGGNIDKGKKEGGKKEGSDKSVDGDGMVNADGTLVEVNGEMKMPEGVNMGDGNGRWLDSPVPEVQDSNAKLVPSPSQVPAPTSPSLPTSNSASPTAQLQSQDAPAPEVLPSVTSEASKPDSTPKPQPDAEISSQTLVQPISNHEHQTTVPIESPPVAAPSTLLLELKTEPQPTTTTSNPSIGLP